MILKLRKTRIKVPRDLGPISRIDRAAESRPEDVGLNRKHVEAIWTHVEELYRTGLQPAITLVLRRHGKIVLKRAIGCVSGNEPDDKRPLVPLEPDSPICLFSASKAITALLVHKAVEQNLLSLDDRVVDYVPEFGAHGKDKVTLRQLMAHRAGIPSIPIKNPDPRLLLDWDKIVNILCTAKPSNQRFERQAYHALTAGYVVGELLRRATKRELPDLMREWLAAPLGARYLTYGLAPEHRHLAPRNVFLGPKLWPVTSFAKRILGASFDRAVEISNDDAFLSAVIPAGNIYASADEACRVYQMMLNGGVLDGVRVFKPDTIEEAVRPVGPIQMDGMLLVPLRFSAGFLLGENPVGLYGPRTKDAYGHLGFINILCWADPHRDISASLLTTGKSMAPDGILKLVRVLGAISRACPPTA
jgi:CubicO group peptidase (beta-lactamase class C family)